MVVFIVDCRHGFSGVVEHTVIVQGQPHEDMNVASLKTSLRYATRAHRRDISIIQGASVLPDDKPLPELVDWFHLETLPRWARFNITVDFVVNQHVCTFCEQRLEPRSSPNRCCELARYCCNHCQGMDWHRHRRECPRIVGPRRVGPREGPRIVRPDRLHPV